MVKSTTRLIENDIDAMGPPFYIVSDITNYDADSTNRILLVCDKKPVYDKEPIQGVPPKIKDVIFNNPATIVFFEDGTKSIVKCQEGEFDKTIGMAMALLKKVYSNTVYDEFKKYIWECEDDESVE